MKRAFAIGALVLASCGGHRYDTKRVTYPNGKPRWEYATVDGVPHGLSRVFHPNGELQSEGSYVAGAKHGLFTFWTEDGEFIRRALFSDDAEIWSTTDFYTRPPTDLIVGLDTTAREIEARERPQGLRFSKQPPAPYFATLDRTNGIDRVGGQVGYGEGGVVRWDLFGNYAIRKIGVYGQLSQTQARAPSAPITSSERTLSGRRTLEAGATLPVALDIGTLTPRAGVLVPIGNDNMAGFVASSAGARQRVTDAAASVPGTVALRTGASLTRGMRRVVLQADGGIDWLFGAQEAPFDALVRANAGVGVGVRSLLFSAELTNAMRISDPSLRMHALGLGATLWLDRAWLTVLGTQTFDGDTSLSGVFGYEL